MLQEYFEVVERNNLMEKLARKREENANIAQGAGALGPDASTEQPVVEPSRVVTASLHITDFADGMGRILAQSDFHKRASFQKEALSLAGAGQFLLKNRTLAGAGVGAAGGALAGGPDHRISGALGGAALGAAGGHAGGGIYSGMAGGQTLGQAASAYKAGLSGMKLPVAAPAAATPAAAANTVGRRVSVNKLRPRPAAPAAGQVVPPTPAAAVGQVVPPAAPAAAAPAARQVVPAQAPAPAAGQVVPAQAAAAPAAGRVAPSPAHARENVEWGAQRAAADWEAKAQAGAASARPQPFFPPTTPGSDAALRDAAIGRAKQQRVDALGSRVDARMAKQDSQTARVKADVAKKPYRETNVMGADGNLVRNASGKVVQASLRDRFLSEADRQGLWG